MNDKVKPYVWAGPVSDLPKLLECVENKANIYKVPGIGGSGLVYDINNMIRWLDKNKNINPSDYTEIKKAGTSKLSFPANIPRTDECFDKEVAAYYNTWSNICRLFSFDPHFSPDELSAWRNHKKHWYVILEQELPLIYDNKDSKYHERIDCLLISKRPPKENEITKNSGDYKSMALILEFKYQYILGDPPKTKRYHGILSKNSFTFTMGKKCINDKWCLYEPYYTVYPERSDYESAKKDNVDNPVDIDFLVKNNIIVNYYFNSVEISIIIIDALSQNIANPKNG